MTVEVRLSLDSLEDSRLHNVTFSVSEFDLALELAKARIKSLPFGALLGTLDKSNSTGQATRLVHVRGTGYIEVEGWEESETEECGNCGRTVDMSDSDEYCSDCEVCEECCHCDEWYCDSHEDYHSDDTDRCSNCDYCDNRCECIRCEGCGDIEEDFCSNCEQCTNGCCDCSHCIDCGKAHSAGTGGEGICGECDKCREDCCNCEDGEDYE